jgi:hypothetical protein
MVHRADVLAAELGSPALSDALWAQLEEAVERTAANMNAQEVSNCLYACAKLERAPGEATCGVLLAAVPAVSNGMIAQEVSNTLWALANFVI